MPKQEKQRKKKLEAPPGAVKPLTQAQKRMVLNQIINCVSDIERQLPKVLDACRWGLQKGKQACVTDFATRLFDLADAIHKYKAESFTLDDMQDYDGWPKPVSAVSALDDEPDWSGSCFR